MKVSVVVPVFNEALVFPELHRRMTAALAACGTYEVVVTDNGSTDGTRELLRRAAEEDPRWRAVFLSRNFGHQNSLICGMVAAQGDAIVSIDGDLQDPPELIPRMLEEIRNGAEIVNTVRTVRRGEARWRMTAIRTFYRVIGTLSGKSVVNDSGDFRAMTRRARDELMGFPESALFVRGIVPLLGLKQVTVPYERDGRFAGESKMKFLPLLAFAIDGITSTTKLPLRLAVVLGFFVFGASILTAVVASAVRLWSDVYVPGWTTLVVLGCALLGMNMFFMGILGEYVAKIFDEVKRRPRFIVEESIGRGLR